MKRTCVGCLLGVVVVGCLLGGGALAAERGTARVIFDGKSLAGWTTGNGSPVTAGWVVENGCLHRQSRGGSIYTDRQYTNFVLELEWKISPKGNSGIKYRCTKYGKSDNGPEYQILDDNGHPDAQKGDDQRKAACLYDILKADTKDVYRPAGQWNQAKIVADGPRVEHWLNGEKVLSYDASTPAFKAAVQDSKFKAYPDYAARLGGRIQLQDHNDLVWYRNIRITER